MKGKESNTPGNKLNVDIKVVPNLPCGKNKKYLESKEKIK